MAFVRTLGLVAGISAGLLGGSAAAVPRPVTVNGLAAVVNDYIITREDLAEEISPTLEAMTRQYAGDPEQFAEMRERAVKEGIEALIRRKLILSAFENSDFVMPEEVIEDAIRDRIREQYGTRVELVKTLQAQGKTYESFRKDMRERIIVEAMTRENVASEVIISPFKIQQYYLEHIEDYQLEDQVRLRMIVLNKAQHGKRTHELAEEILRKIKEGAEFAVMAGIYSDGSQRKENGSWGWVERSVLREDLSEIAFQLEPGVPSDLIEKEEAIYLMLVEKKRPAHVKPLAEVREEIENILMAQERDRLLQQWIDKLKAKSFVRLY